MKKNFFIIIFFIFGLAQKSFAYSSDPKQFIQEVVDEAKQILVDANSKEYKTKKLSEIALQTDDIKGVAISVSSVPGYADRPLITLNIVFSLIEQRKRRLRQIRPTRNFSHYLGRRTGCGDLPLKGI